MRVADTAVRVAVARARRTNHRYPVVWFGLVWFGVVWFGLVWFGLVWFGLVWFGCGGLFRSSGAVCSVPVGRFVPFQWGGLFRSSGAVCSVPVGRPRGNKNPL